jgi:hypothetical protein
MDIFSVFFGAIEVYLKEPLKRERKREREECTVD